MSPQPAQPDIEEHELPCIEAVLAGTLALMTGYSQALQAELHPRQRVLMGEKIGENLAMLVQHPQLSLGFRQVLLGLQRRWQAMGECTAQAAPRHGEAGVGASGLPIRFHVGAPTRLQ
ncbi:MAG TPA: hypothetical protein VGM74_14050 [Burkholderiaceae bacterium]